VDPIPFGETIDMVAIGCAPPAGCWDEAVDCYFDPYLGDGAVYTFVLPDTYFGPRIRTDGDTVIYVNIDPAVWSVVGDCAYLMTPGGLVIDTD
jgi:hypothetical protein